MLDEKHAADRCRDRQPPAASDADHEFEVGAKLVASVVAPSRVGEYSLREGCVGPGLTLP